MDTGPARTARRAAEADHRVAGPRAVGRPAGSHRALARPTTDRGTSAVPTRRRINRVRDGIAANPVSDRGGRLGRMTAPDRRAAIGRRVHTTGRRARHVAIGQRAHMTTRPARRGVTDRLALARRIHGTGTRIATGIRAEIDTPNDARRTESIAIPTAVPSTIDRPDLDRQRCRHLTRSSRARS